MGQASGNCCTHHKSQPEKISKASKKVAKKYLFDESELLVTFQKFDVNKDEVLDLTEFADVLEDLGVTFNAFSVKRVFAFLDSDGSGGVSFEEFRDLMANKDRRLGLNKILQMAVKKSNKGRKAEKVEVKSADHDVFLLCASAHEEDFDAMRPWWIATVLEFVEISCTGRFMSMKMADPSMTTTVPPEKTGSIDKCECACLLLAGNSACTEEILEQIRVAEDLEIQVTCLWEVEDGIQEVLEEFRESCPYAFNRRACPISRHFVSDSEQVILQSVHEMLGRETPVLGLLRPPGGDVGDFRELCLDGVIYLEPAFGMVVKGWDGQADIPPGGFIEPGFRRPVYVSYPREDPEKIGMSDGQCAQMREMIRQVRAAGRVIFIDAFSLKDGNLLGGLQLAQVLSLSRFIILDEVNPNAKDTRPYLSRGNCFLEATVCMLSGLLFPRYKMQFVELDNAIGTEVEDGTNFRKFFRDNASSRELVVEKLCNTLRSKDFASPAECENAVNILTAVLRKHPLMQEGSEGMEW
eukprot:TRINITY_DN1777_c2_g1_i3.p1 TRINITY_DN1777_c2_g1~~TRINITY_DN1777_c2_g1_i3.p1  ORF type:complete len:523 (+),score=112.62 TRINITY_DN1777_c2_g1_i3:190-1758(+)